MIEGRQEEYYQERAPIYEQIYYRDHPGRQSELAAERERLAALAQSARVLELACGTGYWTEVMSRTAESIVASDFAEEMIVEAKRKEFRCPVEFVRADMFTGDFGRAAFDLVALGFWFSHQARQGYDVFFDAVTRPLVPNGRIWMVDNNPSAEGGIHKSLRVDEHGNHFQMRALPDGREYEILKNYFSGSDLEQIFAPRFEIDSLVFGDFYWSVVLRLKTASG
jgi:ubiquinone/menaquinone biosynthesis C-methylase UbiE